MPARIVIVEDTAARPPHLIEQEVLRIGGSPDCDLQFNQIPPYALTVYYRQNAYYVVNRSDLLFELAGIPMLPGETHRWAAGQEITVGPRLLLRLEVSSDPSPIPRAAWAAGAADDPFTDDQAERRIRRNRRKVFLWIAVVAGVAAVFISGSRLPESPAASASDGLNAALQELRRPGGDDARRREVARLLQAGRAEERRGDRKQARAAYAAARNILVGKLGRDADVAADSLWSVRDYVNRRLIEISD